MSDATIRQWLNNAKDYPAPNGRNGWIANRDELVALLSECTPHLSASVIPDPLTDTTVTFFVRLSLTFDRTELSDEVTP